MFPDRFDGQPGLLDTSKESQQVALALFPHFAHDAHDLIPRSKMLGRSSAGCFWQADFTAARLILPRGVRGMDCIAHHFDGILCSARCDLSQPCSARIVSSLGSVSTTAMPTASP